MKCTKRPPTYDVILYDGSETSIEEIRQAIYEFNAIELEHIEYSWSHSSADYIKLFQYASGYWSEKKKEVIVEKGDYAVIREDGKYYSYTEAEVHNWMRAEED